MKKFILVCLTVCGTSYGFSQDNISIFVAQNLATFKYNDTQGNSDPNMSSSLRLGYGANYSKVFNSGFFIRPEIAYQNLGAVSILNNQKLDWSLNYFNFNLGFGYLIHLGPVVPFIGVSPYASYLYKASQTYGTDYYDMLADKGIQTSDYGVNIFGGLKYQFIEVASAFIEVSDVIGLNQLETNNISGHNEKLYNRAIAFRFGVSFNIVSNSRARKRSNF